MLILSKIIFIKKIIFKKIDTFIINYFNFALKVENSFLMAIVLSYFTKRLKKENYKYNKKNKRILFLSRRIFINDVNALNIASPDIIFLEISSRPIKTIFSHFLGNFELNDYNYEIEIEKYKDYQEKLYNFLKKTVIYWKKICKFDAVLSCNFVYSLQTELTKACIDNKIPFFILYKEGLFPEQQLNSLIKDKYYNGKVQIYGTKMFVYNERVKKSISQLPWIDEKKIIVTGVPRIDLLFKNKFLNENIVTLFFSFPSDKFLFFGDTISKLAIEKLIKFYINFIYISKKFKKIKFIIKIKGNKSHMDYIKTLIKSNNIDPGENLEITGSQLTDFLITNSKIVLSFSSTVLLEALVLKKVIAEPDLRDIIPKGWGLFDKYPNATNFISNIDQLEDIIINYDKYKPEENARVNVLKEYLYDIGGNSSKIVNQEMLSIIEKIGKI